MVSLNFLVQFINSVQLIREDIIYTLKEFFPWPFLIARYSQPENLRGDGKENNSITFNTKEVQNITNNSKEINKDSENKVRKQKTLRSVAFIRKSSNPSHSNGWNWVVKNDKTWKCDGIILSMLLFVSLCIHYLGSKETAIDEIVIISLCKWHGYVIMSSIWYKATNYIICVMLCYTFHHFYVILACNLCCWYCPDKILVTPYLP